MIPYAIYILMAIVLSILYDGQEECTNRKKVWYGIMCLYLVLLAGFRNGVGGDTQLYMHTFEYVPSEWSELRDFISEEIIYSGYMPGWSVLVFLCKRWFDSFYAVQLIQALIVNIGVFYLFRQYTSHIFLCVLLYGLSYTFFMFNMEVMREAIAVVLCGVGMHKYLRGEKWKFYLLVGISLLFHTSALIALIFPIARFREINVKTMAFAFLSSLALFLLSDAIVTYLPAILGSAANRTVEKIIMYSDVTLNIFGFLENALRYLVMEAGMIYFAQWSLGEDEQRLQDYNRYMSFYLIVTVLICGFVGFTRFRNYTLIFFLIMLTEFLYHHKSQLCNNAMIKVIMLACIFFYIGRYYLTYYPETHGYKYEFYYPYTSVLDDNVDTSKRQDMHTEANFKVSYSREQNN